MTTTVRSLNRTSSPHTIEMAEFSVTSVLSVDHITLHDAPERVTVGSCGFYTALALAKLGAQVLYAGAHGSDFGLEQLNPLRDAGAQVEGCLLPGKSARLDLVYGADGNVQYARYDEGEGASFRSRHLPMAFGDAPVLWLGTAPYDFQLEVARQAEAGQQVYLSPQGELVGRSDDLLRLTPHVTTLFVNNGELAGFGFGGERESISALRAANPHLTLVITRSAQGAWLITPEGVYSVPAVPDPLIVNTTGAGDTFNAAYALQTLRGAAPEEALQWATAAAALSMRGYAYYALPTAGEVDTYLDTIRSAIPVSVLPDF
ncbi:MAG: carbohydrate kinase family protein [Anaerolineae bacterium]